MSSDESYLKVKADCGCGCGLYGTPKKVNRAGVQCVRLCKCPSCRGRNNKRKGQKKQAKAVTALGVPRTSIHPGHEEFLGGQVRLEVKAGGQIAPAYTAFVKCEAQSAASRAIGDNRPFAAVFMPDGTKDGIVCVRLSQLDDFVAGYAQNWAAS